MTRTDTVITESGLELSDEEVALVARAATRHTNMVGGRYSDNLRAELDTLTSLGLDDYRNLIDDSSRVLRGMGY